MEIIVYIGIAQALFLGALILSKSNKKIFDYILVSWLVLNAIQLFYFNLNFQETTNQYNQSILILIGLLPYLVAPLLYFYVSALVKPRLFSIQKNWYHFIPFLGMLFLILYHHHFNSAVKIWVVDGYIHHSGDVPILISYYSLIMAFFSFLYPTICLLLIFKHQKRISNEFSYQEQVTMNWLKHWIILEFIAFWVSFLIVWAGEFEWVDTIFSFKVIALVIIFNIVVIGFFGIKQRAIFTNIEPSKPIPEPINESPKYEKSGISKEDLKSLADKLDLVMKSQKVYLDPKLQIDQLATLVDTKKHNLSQVLNDHLDINFYEYVNKHRVDEFKERVLDESNNHLSLLGIALDCGFNSKSSFNSIFKKSEGITPSAFRNKIKSN